MLLASKAVPMNKKSEEERKKSQILLEQENKIIQLKEQLEKLQAVHKTDVANLMAKLKDAEGNALQLRDTIAKKDAKYAELQESSQKAAKAVQELYEIKANLITTNEEFKKLKLQLHAMQEEKDSLEKKHTIELNAVTSKYEEQVRFVCDKNAKEVEVKDVAQGIENEWAYEGIRGKVQRGSAKS